MTRNAKAEPALLRRLETLTGEDAACCIADWRVEAETARQTPGFETTLARAKALSDEKRLLAALLLRARGELCGCELQAALSLTHATVSHHMGVLAAAGLVTSEKRGKWTYYQLLPEAASLLP